MSGMRLTCRLAIRAEGDYVNAYHAEIGTLERATLLGSIRRNLCEQQPGVFDRWKALMTDVYAQVIEDAVGVRPVMHDEPAPPHEKAGRA